MKTSEVFKRVKIHVTYEAHMAHFNYICYALSELYLRGAIGDRDRTKCKKIISGLLAPAMTLNHWLEQEHGIRIEDSDAYRTKMKTTRKAWLDHLINHYEAKGD